MYAMERRRRVPLSAHALDVATVVWYRRPRYACGVYSGESVISADVVYPRHVLRLPQMGCASHVRKRARRRMFAKYSVMFFMNNGMVCDVGALYQISLFSV